MKLPISRYGLREVFLFTSLLSLLFLLSLYLLSPTSLKITGPLFLTAIAFVFYFFRDPERPILKDERKLLAPADGRVMEIALVEEKEFLHKEATKISIFMSLFDVHVNRIPCSGRVEYLSHQDGRFLDARRKEASLENECNFIGLVADGGRRLLVKQVAGIIARRIVCPLSTGDYLEQGQRFGMIKFGSRAEVFIPKGIPCKVLVKEGQKVKAGLTVLAELG
ncbi:MAG: phosphatidylserine decarboxylase [Planctomycetes bacterium RIFCSPHIGHO2_12_FULL_52_36]|nr:MAG: phosphatidylserine decarboxylase [Planctomycetes bacterium RIFCSPHIGHO2_12_FULL_52_36]